MTNSLVVFKSFMAKHVVRDAVDTQLRKIGSDIEAFLRAGLGRGASPTTLADELSQLTSIDVSYRSVYRWIEDLGIKEAS